MSRIEKSPSSDVGKDLTQCEWCEREVGAACGLCRRCYEDYREDSEARNGNGEWPSWLRHRP